MAKDQSVAPKERVNITYKPKGEGDAEVELPLHLLMVGEYTGKEDDTPLKERELKNVNKDNFNAVMASQNLELEFSVDNQLTDEEGAKLPVKLKVETLADYGPDRIVEQVEELRKLKELRDALLTLQAPLANIPGFKKKLQQLLKDDAQRQKLVSELGIGDSSEG